MESRHIKLEYEDVLAGKKHLLSSEINFLNVLSKIRNYRELRKKELLLKEKLRVRLRALRGRLDLMQSYFPEDIEIKSRKKQKPLSRKSRDAKDYKDIRKELGEIKAKLEKLG